MSDKVGRKGLVATTAALVGLAALVWVVSALEWAAASDAEATQLTGMTVAVPLVLVAVVASVAWFSLSRARRDDEEQDPRVECGVCNRSILREWRLCPYCGSRFDDDRVDQQSARTAR